MGAEIFFPRALYRWSDFQAALAQVHPGHDLDTLKAPQLLGRPKELKILDKACLQLSHAHPAHPSPFSSVASYLLQYRQNLPPLKIPIGPVNAALYLYSAGGPPYQSDAEALIKLLSGANTYGTQMTHWLDWAFAESRLMACPEGHFKSPEQQWLAGLSHEVEGDHRTKRQGTADVFASSPHILLQQAREIPPPAGAFPQRLVYRSHVLIVELTRILQTSFRLDAHDLDLLAEKLARQISRLEEGKKPLSDSEINELGNILIHELENLSFTGGYRSDTISTIEVEILMRLTVGSFLALQRSLRKNLKKIPEAGDIARTMASLAGKTRDPWEYAHLMLKRWMDTYEEIIKNSPDYPHINIIAEAIARVTMTSEHPLENAQYFLVQLKKATPPTVGNHVKPFSSLSVDSTDLPQAAKNVRKMIDRWLKVYKQVFRLLPNAVKNKKIAVLIASEAFSSTRPQSKVKILCQNWQEAYAKIRGTFPDLLSDKAVDIASQAMLSSKPALTACLLAYPKK